MSDEFKKPVENLKISYDYVNEMLDIQYDINMKFIKDLSDALDVEIIGMLTPSQLKKNAKVIKLTEFIRQAHSHMTIAKAKIAPTTTNSFADTWLKDSLEYLKEFEDEATQRQS